MMFRKNMLIGVVFVAGSLIEAFSMNVNINIGMKAHLSSLLKIGDLSLLHESSENPREKNLLMHLIEIGQYEAAEFLIESGANLNIQDIDGRAALMYATFRGRLDIMETLIVNGANLNIQDIKGHTALMIAAFRGRLDIVQTLIVNGANVNIQDADWSTALMIATFRGRLDIVQTLIVNGAKLNIQDIDGRTALMHAAMCFSNDAAWCLIENGAGVNIVSKGGSTALIYAAQKDYAAVTMYLIRKGARLDIRNSQGCTALMSAAICGGISAASVILSTDLSTIDNVEIKCGNTALMLAIEKNHVLIAHDLIQKGARLDVRNRDGYTALMFAALCGNLDVVRSILWKDGSSIDDEFLPNKLTALMFAIKKGHNSVAMVLIDRGASLTMANIQGHSALMLAAICGNTEIVDFIMKRNRNLANQVDKNGHTALVHATYKKHDDIKKILLAYAAK